MNNKDISTLILIILMIIIILKIINISMRLLLLKIAEKRIKEIEKNPKWLTPKLKESYYGFNDIDIILAESSYPILPYFRISKNNKRFELFIPNDITTNEIDVVAQLALAGKIKMKYNLLYLDKSVYWLSVLCYILDGGDIYIHNKENET